MELVVLPRKTLSWDTFVRDTPVMSIALDGVVSGGPAWDEKTLHVNFDHHDGVVREASMSTSMQVYFALKGGLMSRFAPDHTKIYVNDPDQDTTFSTWLLMNHKKLSGVQSHPIINRLLALTDRWDITGGAFPMSLDDTLVRQHCWVFYPYTSLRKLGLIATADADMMRSIMELCMARLDAALLGNAKESSLDTRHEILYTSPKFPFKIVDEIGGNEARYHLFSNNLLDGYISKIATRPDGRHVYTIGRRSRYVSFPVPELYKVLSDAEPTSRGPVSWGGSDIVGGSDRALGSGLSWQELAEVVTSFLSKTT